MPAPGRGGASGLRPVPGRVERPDRVPCGRRAALRTSLILPDLAATETLARRLAPLLRPGDLLGLAGGLGTGKTAFARALIGARLAALGRAEEVPSPSFTLVQTYDLGETEIWHADLYRLGSLDELAELGLDQAFGTAICLVEWADRLGPLLPPRHLMLALDFLPGDDDARRADLIARGPGWAALAPILAEPRPA